MKKKTGKVLKVRMAFGAGTVVSLLALVACVQCAGNVFCYYSSWATYRPYPAKYQVTDIDTTLCTHIIYAFAGLDENTNTIKSLDPYNDLEENFGLGNYKKFTALQGTVPLLAIGGWNEGSVKYSQMAANSASRQQFVGSVVPYLQAYGFKGLSLDWEYPNKRDGVPEDRANFALLCQELSQSLHAAGLILVVAVGASNGMTVDSYDVPAFNPSVDFINMMTFDYHTAASDNVTGPVSPLEARPEDGEPHNIRASVQEWLDAGASKEKLTIGLPFYGRSYRLLDSNNHGFGDRVTGAGEPGTYTLEAGYLAYYEICQGTWNVVTENGEVYGYQNDQWVSYETPDSLTAKANFINEMGLAGTMVWALEVDDFHGFCGPQKGLLVAINTVLRRKN